MLAAPSNQFVVKLAAHHLTYLPSDLGPEGATWPRPVLWLPSRGLWILDPGRNIASWRLLAISPQGQLKWELPLAVGLNLARPEHFVPCFLGIDPLGRVSLLGSRSFDSEQHKQHNFVLATFTAEGKIAEIRDLPSPFAFRGHSAILGDSTLLNLEGDLKAPTWFAYLPNRTRKSVGSAKGATNPVAMLLGTRNALVLEKSAPQQGRLIRAPEQLEAVNWSTSPGSAAPVNGEGHYFGFVDVLAPEEKSPGAFEQRRWLTLACWKPEAKSIIHLARVPLASARSSSSNPEDFVYYRSSEAIVDAQGNFYDLAWSPLALTVQKYEVDRKTLEKALAPAPLPPP